VNERSTQKLASLTAVYKGKKRFGVRTPFGQGLPLQGRGTAAEDARCGRKRWVQPWCVPQQSDRLDQMSEATLPPTREQPRGELGPRQPPWPLGACVRGHQAAAVAGVHASGAVTGGRARPRMA